MRFGGVISVDLCQQSDIIKLFPNLLAEVIQIFLKGQFTGSLREREGHTSSPVTSGKLFNIQVFFSVCFVLNYFIIVCQYVWRRTVFHMVLSLVENL